MAKVSRKADNICQLCGRRLILHTIREREDCTAVLELLEKMRGSGNQNTRQTYFGES